MKVLEIVAATLPQAFGMMLSPLLLIALVAVLIGAKPVPKGIAFSLGWCAAILVLIYGAVQLGIANASQSPTLTNGVMRVIVGAFFLVIEIKNYRIAWRERENPASPPWLPRMETLSVPAVFGVSFLLAITAGKPCRSLPSW